MLYVDWVSVDLNLTLRFFSRHSGFLPPQNWLLNPICRTPLITVLCTEGLSWINIRNYYNLTKWWSPWAITLQKYRSSKGGHHLKIKARFYKTNVNIGNIIIRRENCPLPLSKLFICTFPNVESGSLSLPHVFNTCDYVTVTCSGPRLRWILVLLPPWCTKNWGLHWSSTSRTTIIYWALANSSRGPVAPNMCFPINVIFWQFQFLSNGKFPVIYCHWKNSRSSNHIIHDFV